MTDVTLERTSTAAPPARRRALRRRAPADRPARSPGLLLALVLGGQFMAVLDASVVNVAAPTIRADLHASGAGLQLVVAGYTIAYAVLLVSGARTGDLLGQHRAFLAGLGLFTVASLACALAPTTTSLVAFRCLQGAGAALMVPQVLSLIQRSFGGAALARALSLYSAVIAGGIVVGQVAGGLLVSADLFGTGWRPVFAVNVPIGVALLAAGARILPRDRGEPGRGLDLPGLLTLSPAVLLLVVPLVFGPQEGWPAVGWLALAATVPVFAAFLAVERRARAPLFPGRVLGAPGMVPAALTQFIAMSTYGGFLLATALHLQSGLGDSPLRAGLTFVPTATGFTLTSLNWRRVPQRWHRPMIPAGLLLAAAGYLATALILRGGGHGGAPLVLALAATGLGFGASFSPLLTVALTHVPTADAAEASGLLATLIQLAIVVGIATFGTLYLTLVRHPAAHLAAARTALASAHAEAVTLGALAVTTLVAAACALPLVRTGQ